MQLPFRALALVLHVRIVSGGSALLDLCRGTISNCLCQARLEGDGKDCATADQDVRAKPPVAVAELCVFKAVSTVQALAHPGNTYARASSLLEDSKILRDLVEDHQLRFVSLRSPQNR